MIVLNTAKELIHIEAWDDVTARPGFTAHLDPSAHTLSAIIGQYAFSDKIPCGLSDCQTPHGKGYLVATTDGRETNIGSVCGKRYFGVEFDAMVRTFERDFTEKTNREALASFSLALDRYKQQVHELRFSDRGANWIHTTLRPFREQRPEVPQEVRRRLEQMAKTRTSVLTVDREATAREAELQDAASNRRLPRPVFVQEPIANIDGLQALYPDNDLRALLVIDLEENIKKFESEDIDALGFEPLARWAKWIGTVSSTLDRAIASIGHGRGFLQAQNLEPFVRIVGDANDAARFQKFLKSLARR